MIIWLKILIALVAGVLLISCAPGMVEGPAPQRVRDERPVEVGRRPSTFTETFRWSDGLSVEIVAIDHTLLADPAQVDSPGARTGDPCSELTVVVRNGSRYAATVGLTARLRYGPDLVPAGSYIASAGHADSASTQIVKAGEVSYPYVLGFVLPVEGRRDVVVDLGIDDWRHERAVFAGSIAA
jgi:hypothetical protein